jgi:hypothetical protein
MHGNLLPEGEGLVEMHVLTMPRYAVCTINTWQNMSNRTLSLATPANSKESASATAHGYTCSLDISKSSGTLYFKLRYQFCAVCDAALCM